jgi:hypothetical protein
MSPQRMVASLVTMLVLASSCPSWAADPEPEQLVDRVRRSIDRSVQFLRDMERGSGHWERDQLAANYKGGCTSLALLALLNAGVKPDDPAVSRGLKWLRKIEPRQTYVVGLQTMVFAEVNSPRDRILIQENANWLLDARVRANQELRGWSYGRGLGINADNSNTQYAMLGLHAAHSVGVKIDREVWKSIRSFYQRSQDPGSGAWGYGMGRGDTRLTMTTAGLCGLIIAGNDLNEGREILLPNGKAQNCGEYEENEHAAKALQWIGRHFRVRDTPHIFYNLYGIERAGRLSGLRFFNDHDWYREGCEYLTSLQRDDGSWQSRDLDGSQIVATSFALLFLSKGRTPVLISKLVHGAGAEPGSDWNNDRNDARHLVEYASRELFKRQPLAWQIFNCRKLNVANAEDIRTLTRDLLQSPIAYFNGHNAPLFTDIELEMLKQYVDQGGFIMAEACCGSPAFDQGFRKLMEHLFPDTPLKELSPEHPIWRIHAVVKPHEPFKLLGIEQGCKTVVVYSPQDLSCLWEANKTDNDRGLQAFRLGGNIIAYATGLEPPQPRLTPAQMMANENEPLKGRRGYLKVGQLRHQGDWQPAPRAMRNLLYHLRYKALLPVDIKTEEVLPAREDLLNYKVMYMHGRNEFRYPPESLKYLRANLETGGLLLADACCGKERFDTAFRTFVTELLPTAKLERIPLTDELYGKEINGQAITTVRCRRDRAAGPDAEFREAAPFLEGVKINDRWAIIYSRYDLGCALETPKSTSADCLGYDHESALRLASAAVLYALKR